ncbi:MAG: DegT/DnrJ/EryC1/StrS aminotransferase family protein [Candidatus Parcubacteria bacterium]|nr:DegT/DnrJ/EryC1/StrS aminotransferase family protein [Candidatus Parcubacteria bacterium]
MIPLMRNAFLHESETKKALADFIIKSDKLSMGEKCVEFEKAFAKKQGRKEAVLFNSGGSSNLAILQTLKNLGRLKEKDAVGFSALTWSTNVMPIIQMGLIPVIVDCDSLTLNVMSEQVKQTLREKKIQALFITNALGFAGDLENIKKLCEKNKIILLEDNCESLGTKLQDGKTGNFGLASSFSFFVAHHMSTIEGGMVCTDDEKFAEMLRIVRANGWDRNLTSKQQQKWRTKFKILSEFQSKYSFYDLGYNLRPTEITGFLGLFQLKYLDENIRVREKNYLRIEKALKKNDDFFILKRDHIKTLSSFSFPFICKTPKLREKYIERFIKAGIEIRPMIAGNMQKQPFYKKYIKKEIKLPHTDIIHKNGFYSGNYPELTEDDFITIENCLRK